MMLSPFASRIITGLALLALAASLYLFALGNFLSENPWRLALSAFAFTGAIISGAYGVAALLGKGR
ncbi:hypothetical protein [Deinococcus sp. S9]|uniref:hypothetical protein n=1 Tax=Deinococcus sp. S9 TaxID=2545754 RepID=UPI00105522D8|nr:hypothetical protein [Deinococcus sp. S9]TDE87417.1 hypothetical protein E0686_02685 [Deinococcus sp. S9]